jgi:hypothetical protein
MRSTTLTGMLREPLLHFALLGALVFGADRWLASRRDDPSLIVVTPQIEEQARSIFRSAQGREPTDAERRILREHWIDTEVLYREGLALKLDQGDTTLRERVVFKAMNMIESNLQVPEPEEAALRAWFEEQRERYDEPARFDFSEAVPASALDAAGARAFAAALNAGASSELQSSLRIFEKRPRRSVVESFGDDFTAELERAPLRRWLVLPSPEGPRVMRLEGRQAGSPVSFESVRGRVRSDWMDARARELRTAAVRELAKKYTVRLGGEAS